MPSDDRGTVGIESVLSEGESMDDGSVLLRNIASGKKVGDLVATTLGPRGRDKVLFPEDEHDEGLTDYFEVTNSGAYLLKQITFQTPAAGVVARVAAAQDDRCGDGTTTSAVYAGNLLSEAGDLIERGFHPSSVIHGVQEAVDLATDAVAANAVEVDPTDGETLEQVVQTTLQGKMAQVLTDEICDWVVEFADETHSLDDFQTESLRAGTLGDTEFFDGMVFKKSFAGNYAPSSLQNARVATVAQSIASAQQIRQRIEHDEVEDQQTVSYAAATPDDLRKFTDYEQDRMRETVRALVEADVDVLLVSNRVDEDMVAYFDSQDIAVVRNVDTDRLKRTAAAVGSTVHTHLEDLALSDIGSVDCVETRSYPEIEQNVIFLRGPTERPLASALVHGSTWSSGWEVERNVGNAVAAATTVVREGRVLPGGGAIEAAIAAHLRSAAPSVGGRESIVVESVADAIESVPRLLAETSGMDPTDALIALNNAHHTGNRTHGVLVPQRELGDTLEAGVLEPASNKRHALEAAAGVASTILRIDDVITNIDVEVRG